MYEHVRAIWEKERVSVDSRNVARGLTTKGGAEE
jgi:hypothetical protein